MKTKKRMLLALAAGFCFTFYGCYISGPTYTDEFDLVITNYDKNATFKGRAFYAMPDKVAKITGNVAQGLPPTYLSEPYASTIINRIQANMLALGYTLVTDTALAEFVLFPSEMEVTNISYYYDYYYYYWGWYYPGGGWYYPYYPVTTTYTTGTIIVNMVDLRNPGANDKLHAVWSTIINGVMDGDVTTAISRINTTIDQAYEQSQYLHQ